MFKLHYPHSRAVPFGGVFTRNLLSETQILSKCLMRLSASKLCSYSSHTAELWSILRDFDKKRHQVDNFIPLESNYVDNLEIHEPDLIVADLSYWDPNHNLWSSSLEEFKFMPQIALRNPDWCLASYEWLINSILNRWRKTVLFIETWVISKEKVSSIIPTWVDRIYSQPSVWYSITRIDLNKLK